METNWKTLDPKRSRVLVMISGACDVKQFDDLLTHAKSESIIQCSLLAAFHGHRGKYVNPRLRSKFEEYNCMPDLSNETLVLWECDGLSAVTSYYST